MHANIMYKAADYLRLSKDDGDFSFSSGKTESNSISSQRELIRTFAEKAPDIELVAEFVDDGYTGTNFNRPAFQDMLKAVERGDINCIIVKDLSRFGREYIDAGQYIEKLFPQKGVRFIAVNDHYDSMTSTSAGDSLIVPFKNLLNDSYSRDISIKVRSSLESKRQRGEFIANFAVYGYMRDPEDKNKLAPDSYAAAVVRDIFRWKIEGLSPQKIADRLNDRGILCPAEYKKEAGSRYKTSFQTHSQAKWSPGSVLRILSNEVYCGVLIQGRRTTPNYKVKRVVFKEASEWSRTEDAHEAIIGRNEFQIVQRLLGEDCRSAPGTGHVHPLSGRVYCGSCDKPAKRRVVTYKAKRYVYYNCPDGGKQGACLGRSISEEELESAVLATLQTQIKVILDMDKALAQIDALSWEKRESQRLEADMAVLKEKLAKNHAMIANIYEDFRDGLIDREEMLHLKAGFSERIRQTQDSLSLLSQKQTELQQGPLDPQSWMGQFRTYRNVTELSRTLIVNLVDRILLHPDKNIQVELFHKDQIQQAISLVGRRHPEKEALSSDLKEVI